MRKIFFILMCATVFLSISVRGFCQTTEYKTVDVKAEVPFEDGLSLSIYKIAGSTWTSATAVDFGLLTYDSTNHIFRAGCYYAVDVNVDSNAGTWSLTQTIENNIVHETDKTKNLNDNINVTFVHWIADGNENQLGKVMSLTKSNNKVYTKSDVYPGRLRIYYGIANGPGDGDGVVPIGMDKTSGKYAGTIKITLTE